MEETRLQQKPPLSVLLVEDAIPLRQRLNTLLSERNIRVVGEAGNVADALLKFDECRPDAILLDLGLSNGNGINVLRHVKQVRKECVVVVLTNYIMPEFRRHCRDLGADYFFGKADAFERAIQTLQGLAPDSEYSQTRDEGETEATCER